MSIELSNPEQYSELWIKETEHLESHGIYEKLSQHTPKGNTLEFGCGIGNGIKYLSKDREVLSLDSNQYLIDFANTHLESANCNGKIHKCDFFELTAGDKKIIKDFLPKIITGWFVGSHGEDIFKHTPEEPNIVTKSKLYREKIEDIIISRDVCVDSVEYIHFAIRGGLVEGYSDKQIFDETKNDYDTYVFNNIGFEVIEVNNYKWPREGSEFQYGQAHNPVLTKGEVIPMITSIVARRKSK